MKQVFRKIAVALFVFAIANVAYARQWHINNNGNTVAADFTDINAAMNSAEVVNGDTLYLGNGSVFGTQSIGKAVTVIGAGWGGDISPVVSPKINGYLNINAAGAKVIGVRINGDIYITKSNVELVRCCGNSIICNNSGVNNVRIVQCSAFRVEGRDISYNSGWIIKNCILYCDFYIIGRLYRATVENNVLINVYKSLNTYASIIYELSYSTIKNNIMVQGNTNASEYCIYSNNNNVITNNVISLPDSYESRYPNNILLGSNDLAAIFKCTGTRESGEYYSLKEGSPAIGAGESGIDCGVMDGVYKFVPYGRPHNIPILREASVPTMPTDGKIKVTLKFENQNE